MNQALITGLLIFTGCLGLFLIVQRWLHFEIQAIFFLITRRINIALGAFSVLFLPGVFLHEMSHFLMAKLLRVSTGRISLIPKLQENGNLRLGYVETAAVDPVRDSLIGAAPIFSGMALVAVLGGAALGLVPVVESLISGDIHTAWIGFKTIPGKQDFWLWFYLAFTISSTMLPSRSDRRAWLSVLVPVVILMAMGIVAGAGPWMVANLSPWLVRFLNLTSVILGVSIILHVVLWLPALGLRLLLSQLTGLVVK